MKFETSSPLDVYPVGLFRDLRYRKQGWRRLCQALRYPFYQARQRNWRAVKNYFNGYLAEPAEMPPGLRRCGSGWTRRRAVTDYRRRLQRAGGTS